MNKIESFFNLKQFAYLMNAQLHKQEYKSFDSGPYTVKMPELLKAGYQPATTADIMRLRLEALSRKNSGAIGKWIDRWYDTSDGLAYDEHGIKVVRNSALLKAVTPSTRLTIDGALPLGASSERNLLGFSPELNLVH
jgi:hypothetical protein